MLLAYSFPKHIVIRKSLPLLRHLCRSTQGGSIEIAKDLQTDLPWQNIEWVDPDEVGELLGYQGELREAAHCEEALEDQSTSWV